MRSARLYEDVVELALLLLEGLRLQREVVMVPLIECGLQIVVVEGEDEELIRVRLPAEWRPPGRGDRQQTYQAA